MPLQFFNPANTPSRVRYTMGPLIAIDYKTGLFRINSEVCDSLQLKVNDHLQFGQDKEDTGRWYVMKVKSEGFLLKEKKSVSGGLVFSNTALGRTILESGGVKDGRSGKVKVAEKPVKMEGQAMWPLDLSPLKEKKK